MKVSRRLATLLMCGALILVGSPVSADITVFQNDESGWQAAVGAYTTIDWDDVALADGASTTIASDAYDSLLGAPLLSVDANSGLYVGDPNPGTGDNTGFFGLDFKAVSPDNVFSPDAPPPGGPSAGPEGILTITFQDGPMYSIGVWFLDVEGDYDATGIEIGGEEYFFSANQGDDSQSFLGLVSTTPFAVVNIHMSSDSGGNGVGIDDIMYSPVPAPGALFLGAIGLGLVGWFRRKQA